MRTCFCMAGVIVLAMAVSPLRGERIAFRLSGVVSEVSDRAGLLPSTIVAGAPISAELKYDTARADDFPTDPQRGRYRFLPGDDAGGIAISVGGHTFQARTDNDFYVEVDDGLPYLPFDDPGAVLPGTDYFWIPGIEVTNSVNVEYTSLQLFWRDPSTDAFDSDSLPRTLVMTDFVAPTIDITGCGCVETGNGESRSFRIRTTIHSAIAVPEPSTALLVAMIAPLTTWACWHRIPLTVPRMGSQ
jgi:hypothetical protein